MGSKAMVSLLLLMFLAPISPSPTPAIACSYCSHPSYPRPLHPRRPPPDTGMPVIGPPAVVSPPVGTVPPFAWTIPPPPPAKCSFDSLKLGLCLDVLGGLVHVGLGNPVENYCCPVLQGLVELEAAVCLCTAIKLKVLNLNIYIPLALELLITCGMDPPPGYFCPL